MHFSIHILDTQQSFASTGFFIDGASTEYFFDDDGQGNLRIYSLVSGVRTYFGQSTQLTMQNGIIKINSILITSVSNVDPPHQHSFV